MKYYKATDDKHDYFTGWTTVKGELLTKRERDTKFRYVADRYFEEVDIPKSRIFTIFGCRFEKHDA